MSDTTVPQTTPVQFTGEPRNLAVAVALTFFFGPVALVYVSALAGAILAVGWIFLVWLIFVMGGFFFPVMPFVFASAIAWPVAIVLSIVLTIRHNSGLPGYAGSQAEAALGAVGTWLTREPTT